MDELRPCPFCGGEAEVIPHMYFSLALNGWKPERYGVVCKDCNTSGNQFFRGEQQAIEAWNRRRGDGPA